MQPLGIFVIYGLAVAVIATSFFLFHQEKMPLPEFMVENPLKVAKTIPPFEKLDSKYCVHYGNKNAPIKVIEFFSFLCPHCVSLFQKEFFAIKKHLIDTGLIYFEFHPALQDVSTVQSVICLGELTEEEKRLFLEVIFEEADPYDQELITKLMITAMNVFKKPIPCLADHSYFEEHPAFEIVFNFTKQGQVTAIPTVEINGKYYADYVPTFSFLQSFVRN